MKQKLSYSFHLLLSICFILLIGYSCNNGNPPKEEKVYTPEKFPMPLLQYEANEQQVEQFESQKKYIKKEIQQTEEYKQITYLINREPASIHSYIFENEKLTQTISLWKPYTIVFKEQQETALQESFISLLKENNFSDPINHVREFECERKNPYVKLIITPATTSTQERKLVAQLTFLLTPPPQKDDNKNTDDKNKTPEVLPLLVPLCSSFDKIETAEKNSGSTVLINKKEAVAGYFHQEFQMEEKLGEIIIVRRTYLTKAENNMLEIAQVVAIPKTAFWIDKEKDLKEQLITKIKQKGFIDAGLNKSGDTHFFYKPESMTDNRSYTQLQIQQLEVGRYPEINEPAISFIYSRTNNPPTTSF